jgi:glycosyltransferase involved in cell wall biosynthesis
MATLSACIVVKNAKASILKCLDALLPMANEYVIVDTGSTDGTIELVKQWRTKHGNPGFVHEEVGGKFHDEDGIFDFGAAKNYAISLAHCDYVMWVDANDILKDGKDARREFEAIVAKNPDAAIAMDTKVSKTFQFPRLRILKREKAHFTGMIHEMMVDKTDRNGANDIRTKIVFENYKATRDTRRNLLALEKSWKMNRTQRDAFYLGNSYKDLKDLGKAAEWYSVVVDEFPQVLNENRFKSLETICEIYLMGVPDLEELGARAMQMIEEFPDRPEGYFYRARYNFISKNYDLAKKCLLQVNKLNGNDRTTLWHSRKIYDRRYIDSLINNVDVAIERQDIYNLRNAEPMPLEHVDDGGFMGMANCGTGRLGPAYDRFGTFAI